MGRIIYLHYQGKARLEPYADCWDRVNGLYGYVSFNGVNMKHNWEYSEDREDRKCLNCLIEETWDDEHEEWIWMSTDEFMDCKIVCDEKD